MFTSHGEELNDVNFVVFARSSRKLFNFVNFIAEFSPGHKWETAGQVTLQYQKSHSFRYQGKMANLLLILKVSKSNAFEAKFRNFCLSGKK